MSESKNTRRYALYAVGELILIVIGILIAVQIDDYYTEKQRISLEKRYYLEIVTDLKKDSVHFQALKNAFEGYLDRYYLIYNKINQGDVEVPPKTYDWTMYNRAFTPITLNNHQNSVDMINNTKVRGEVNEYFALQLQTQDAFDEFNDLVREFSRPYFISKNAVSAEAVFHDDKYGFLPKGSLLDTEKLEALLKEEKTVQVLAYLRISSGYALYELNRIIAQNEALIKDLSEASKE